MIKILKRFFPNIFMQQTTHQCTPLPTDKIGEEYRLFDSPGYAAWRLNKRTFKISECPVCHKLYNYDYSDFSYVRTINYKEAEQIAKAFNSR